jgi:hypothetical protein
MPECRMNLQKKAKRRKHHEARLAAKAALTSAAKPVPSPAAKAAPVPAAKAVPAPAPKAAAAPAPKSKSEGKSAGGKA